MGRGSKSHESNVVKRTEHFGTGGGSGSESTASDSCLFSLTISIKLSSSVAKDLKQGSKARIIPSHSDEGNLEIFVEGKNIGSYHGSQLQKIRDCIKSGYIYEGEVKRVGINLNDATIVVELTGKGKQ